MTFARKLIFTFYVAAMLCVLCGLVFVHNDAVWYSAIGATAVLGVCMVAGILYEVWRS